MGCISDNLICQMSGFQGATWSLKTGHQVTHLAIERELVEAIRRGHLSIGYSKIPRPLWRSVGQLQGAGCFLDVFVRRYCSVSVTEASFREWEVPGGWLQRKRLGVFGGRVSVTEGGGAFQSWLGYTIGDAAREKREKNQTEAIVEGGNEREREQRRFREKEAKENRGGFWRRRLRKTEEVSGENKGSIVSSSRELWERGDPWSLGESC